MLIAEPLIGFLLRLGQCFCGSSQLTSGEVIPFMAMHPLASPIFDLLGVVSNVALKSNLNH
jgi:hypothetical protein